MDPGAIWELFGGTEIFKAMKKSREHKSSMIEFWDFGKIHSFGTFFWVLESGGRQSGDLQSRATRFVAGNP